MPQSRYASVELKWVILFLLFLLLSLYVVIRHYPGETTPRQVSLDNIIDQGTLKMVTINSPATFFNLRDQNTGFEYDLASEFASHLGVRLDVNVVDSYTDLVDSIRSGQVDIAAANMTITPQRENRVGFGPVYERSQQIVIYRTRTRKPRSLSELVSGTIRVVANSSYEETLVSARAEHPQLLWEADDSTSLDDIFHQINAGELDYTIADNNLFEMYRRYFPRLGEAFAVTDEQAIAWGLPLDADPELMTELEVFFETISGNGRLDELKSRYRSYLDDYNVLNSSYFLNDIEQELPRLEPMFRAAAKRDNFDWRLLAAIAYQESHWKDNARSPTGVEGIMMLTRATASDLGVEDRLDPEQSIDGGSRYLQQLINRIPERIKDPDRTWLALAAYNLGFGHVEDARVITQRNGFNPDLWSAVEKSLPLLTKPEWYKTVKRGYANGFAAVHYVRNIRSYYDILIWRIPET